MRTTCLISALVIATAAYGPATLALAEPNEPPYAAFLELLEAHASLFPLSDRQLASVVGGQTGTPMSTSGGSVDPQVLTQANQIVNQVLAQQSQASASQTNQSSTTVQQSGDTVTVQQTQTRTQVNGSPSTGSQRNGLSSTGGQPVVMTPTSDGQQPVNALQSVVTLNVTRQPDGTSQITVQDGQRTVTIFVPFPLTPQTVVNAVPFQARVFVTQQVVHAIQALSAPVMGSPATMVGMHR